MRMVADEEKGSRHRVQVGKMLKQWIIPGDYVVESSIGIGQYKGLAGSTDPESGQLRRMLVIMFADGEALIDMADSKSVSRYMSFDAPNAESITLSKMFSRRKWEAKKASVTEKTRKLAVNVLALHTIRESHYRQPCGEDGDEYQLFCNNFAFRPTHDQEQCFKDVEKDMIRKSRPMDRLVCGDVGFGKTEVAMRAVYRAVKNGRQAAVMAPTRVLVSQHYRTLQERMPDVNVHLVTSTKDAKRDNMLATGEAQVIVGTHTLLRKSLQFKNLGLLVIDEEQRFGVNHKEKLKSLTSGVDVLTLSATPIPRTLQMSLSGMRDLSLINTPPSGRKPVINRVASPSNELIKSAIEFEMKRSGQVYIVVPFIEQLNNIMLLIQKLVPSARVIDAHGRHTDLVQRVEMFAKHEYDVCVCTVVMENGVDIPKANTILVFYAHRFGMATLYQLRGRVGRSKTQAYAYFLVDDMDKVTQQARRRLKSIEELNDLGAGFDLAMRDLEIRGGGSLFGADQSGDVSAVGYDVYFSILSEAIEKVRTELCVCISAPDVRLGLPAEANLLKIDYAIQKKLEAEANSSTQVTEFRQTTVLQDRKPECSVAAVRDRALAAAHLGAALKITDPRRSDAEVRRLTDCSWPSEVRALRQEWEAKYGTWTSEMEQLCSRAEVTCVARQAGFEAVFREAQDLVMVSRHLTLDKYKSFLNCLRGDWVERCGFSKSFRPSVAVNKSLMKGTPTQQAYTAANVLAALCKGRPALIIEDAFMGTFNGVPQELLDNLAQIAHFCDRQRKEALQVVREESDEKAEDDAEDQPVG